MVLIPAGAFAVEALAVRPSKAKASTANAPSLEMAEVKTKSGIRQKREQIQFGGQVKKTKIIVGRHFRFALMEHPIFVFVI